MKVNMVGIDALGLGKGKNHGVFNRYLADKGIYIIENLINLNSINHEIFTVYCFPLNIDALGAVPSRVVVEV
jgi:kynurenine formamidase